MKTNKFTVPGTSWGQPDKGPVQLLHTDKHNVLIHEWHACKKTQILCEMLPRLVENLLYIIAQSENVCTSYN